MTLKFVALDANNNPDSVMTTVHGLAKVECTQNVYKCYESKISFKTTFPCILRQALPAINALNEFASSASGMHSMKPVCNSREKNYFSPSMLNFIKTKVLFLVLLKALPQRES